MGNKFKNQVRSGAGQTFNFIKKAGHNIGPYWDTASQIVGAIPHPIAQKIGMGMMGISGIAHAGKAISEVSKGRTSGGLAQGLMAGTQLAGMKRAYLGDKGTQEIVKKIRHNVPNPVVIKGGPGGMAKFGVPELAQTARYAVTQGPRTGIQDVKRYMLRKGIERSTGLNLGLFAKGGGIRGPAREGLF